MQTEEDMLVVEARNTGNTEKLFAFWKTKRMALLDRLSHITLPP